MGTKKVPIEDLKIGDRYLDELERVREITDIGDSPYGGYAITSKKVEEEDTGFTFTKTRFENVDVFYAVVV